MVRRVLLALPLVAGTLVWSAWSDYLSAKRKFDMIENGRVQPGGSVALTPQELNAYVQQQAQQAFPEGVREPKVVLGSGVATGSALIDFGKVRRAQGKPPGWLMSQVLDGERPVRVTARLRSGGGKATVDVDSVEVSGMAIDGPVLDYLIRNYLLPNYPGAKVGEPFELGHRIDRLEVRPSAVNVVIAR